MTPQPELETKESSTMNKKVIVILIMFASLTANADGESRVDIVRQFVKHYNSADAEGMLSICTQDVQWLSIIDNEISVETDNRQALREALEAHFSRLIPARSELLETVEAGSKVITVEKAFTQTDAGEKSQCSVAVYDFQGNEISHVWYFDSYEC